MIAPDGAVTSRVAVIDDDRAIREVYIMGRPVGVRAMDANSAVDADVAALAAVA